jgi:UDPglucose 6-dehydrogenase
MIGKPNNRRSVGILGMGHVGRALAAALEPVADVVGYDRADEVEYPGAALARCELVAVCVDTPRAGDGSCDVSNVWDAVRRVPNDRIWIRSTVPPGTTDAIADATHKVVCASPEYFGEHSPPARIWSAAPDEVPFLVVGGRSEHRRILLDLLVPLFGAERTYFQCTAREAELIKYMENAYLATKVAFVNEFERICAAYDADWHTVREGWLLDPRVGRSHSAVFGPMGGFAGRCLPKDLDAIIDASRAAGYEPDLLVEVATSNRRHRAARGEIAASDLPNTVA